MDINRLKDLKVNNDGFAFDSRTGNTYSINATGLRVINSIKTGATKSQIQDQMAEQFNVDLQTLGRDLEIFFNQLELNHLIQAKRLV